MGNPRDDRDITFALEDAKEIAEEICGEHVETDVSTNANSIDVVIRIPDTHIYREVSVKGKTRAQVSELRGLIVQTARDYREEKRR